MLVASVQPRAAWSSRPGCAAPPRCSTQRAAGPHYLAASRGSGSDALLIDAQNVLSRAGAAAAGRRRPGEGVAGSFADWLRFLAAAAQPQLMVAVFDAPAAKRAPQQQREQLAAGYLQRRKRRRQPAAEGQGGSSPASSSSTAAPRPAAGDPLRPFKHQVEQLGGVCLEAAPGWEADDGLAAAAAAVRQRLPTAREVVASGDGDMQQLLAPQVGTSWLTVCAVTGCWPASQVACVLLVRCRHMGGSLAPTLIPRVCATHTFPPPGSSTLHLQVSWLQLHNQTSPACPLGLELVTAADFLHRFGFPPAAYPDWLALVGACCCSFAMIAPQPHPSTVAAHCIGASVTTTVNLTARPSAYCPCAGKREASIGGAGVGGKAAPKLLARYGSLEAVLQAAEAGELKGWGPAAQRLLSGTGDGASEDRAAQLRRNCRLFAANADPLVVQPRGMQQLLAALEHLQPARQAAADEEQQQQQVAWSGMLQAERLAWQHPMHARRWRHLQQVAAEAEQQAAGSGISKGGPWQPRQAATSQGLAVDELVEQPGGGSAALFYVCPCDVAAGSWAQALSMAQQMPAMADATKVLLPLLSGTMRHHVKLVQRAGYSVSLALPPPLLGGALRSQDDSCIVE